MGTVHLRSRFSAADVLPASQAELAKTSAVLRYAVVSGQDPVLAECSGYEVVSDQMPTAASTIWLKARKWVLIQASLNGAGVV